MNYIYLFLSISRAIIFKLFKPSPALFTMLFWYADAQLGYFEGRGGVLIKRTQVYRKCIPQPLLLNTDTHTLNVLR